MSTSNRLSARERINRLLDDSSFVETGAFVHARNTDFGMDKSPTPSDGVITGYGRINDQLVYVYSQDASVLGGTVGEMHAGKIRRIYDLALKTGAPVIGLVDCAGMRLQEATDALNAFGELYRQQVRSSGAILQITAVLGTCGGGMALIPGLTDFTIMTAEGGRLFVNAPNTLDGNREDICDTASAAYQAAQAGTVDFVEKTDEDALDRIRELIGLLPPNSVDGCGYAECDDDLNRVDPSLAQTLDARYILSSIADGHQVCEVRKDHAPEMVTLFLRLGGICVGAVANCGEQTDEEGRTRTQEPVLTSDGARKAEAFIRFCDAFSIPVLTLVNVKGFKATKEEEKTMGKAAAKLIGAYVQATVPKVTLIAGDACSSAYLVMGSRHVGADVVYAYPRARIGMMDPESAVRIIYSDAIEKAADKPSFIREKANEYDALQASPLSAASRGYVDDIIEPAATRKRLIAAFDMLDTKRDGRPPKKHGTI